MVLTVQKNRRCSDAHTGLPCLRRFAAYAMTLSFHGGGFWNRQCHSARHVIPEGFQPEPLHGREAVEHEHGK